MLFYGGFGLGESWSIYSWLQVRGPQLSVRTRRALRISGFVTLRPVSLFRQAAGFVVLVCGTLVYQKGDQEEMNKVSLRTRLRLIRLNSAFAPTSQDMNEAALVDAAEEPVHQSADYSGDYQFDSFPSLRPMSALVAESDETTLLLSQSLRGPLHLRQRQRTSLPPVPRLLSPSPCQVLSKRRTPSCLVRTPASSMSGLTTSMPGRPSRHSSSTKEPWAARGARRRWARRLWHQEAGLQEGATLCSMGMWTATESEASGDLHRRVRPQRTRKRAALSV